MLHRLLPFARLGSPGRRWRPKEGVIVSLYILLGYWNLATDGGGFATELDWIVSVDGRNERAQPGVVHYGIRSMELGRQDVTGDVEYEG